MAKKLPPKPIFSLKEDFKDSLDHFCMQAIMLEQAVRTALELGQIGDKAKPIIEKHLADFRAAMVSDDDGTS